MTALPRAALYTFFEAGDRPTASQFADMIDSALNVADATAQTVMSDVVFSGNLNVLNGVAIGSAAGGLLGQGTLNATKVYVNGAPIGVIASGKGSQIATYSVSGNTLVAASALPDGIMAVTQPSGDGTTKVATNEYAERANKYVLLQNIVASNVSTISFTGLSNNNYTAYEIYCDNISPSINSVNLKMNISTSSVFITASSYVYQVFHWSLAATNFTGANSVSEWIINGADEPLGSATGPLSCKITIYGADNTTNIKRTNWSFEHQAASVSYIAGNGGGAVSTPPAGIDGIMFSMSSGNINSGNFLIYGVKNS